MALVKFSSERDEKIKIRRQTELYNKSFVEWRKQHSRTVGFYPDLSEALSFTVPAFPENGLTSQVSTENLIGDKRKEVAAFRKAVSFIGKLFCIFTAVVLLFRFVIPLILSAAEPSYTYDFFAGKVFGTDSSFIMLLLSALCATVTYAIILFVGIFVLKIPTAVLFPITIISKRMTIAAVPVALILSAVCVFYRRVLGSPEFTFSYDGNTAFTLTRVLLYILIIPVLSELAYRGVFLQFLRQFGDASAVIITAFLSATITTAVMSRNLLISPETVLPTVSPLSIFPTALLCGLCYGYFAFASGSILTPIFMKSVTAIGNIIYLLIRNIKDPTVSMTVLYITAAAAFICGTAAVVWLLCKNSDEIELPGKENKLIPSDKLICLSSPAFLLPMMLLILICLIPN